MPLDTSIALGVQAPQFANPVNMLDMQAQMQQRQENARYNAMREKVLQQEMQKNALGMQYTAQDRARAEADRQKTLAQTAADKAFRERVLQQSGGDPVKASDLAIRLGRPDLAESYAKGRESIAKAGSEESKAKIDQFQSAITELTPALAQVKNPEDAAKFTDVLYSHPVIGPELAKFMPREQAVAAAPQQFQSDPVGFMRSHLLTGKDLYEATTKAAGATAAPELKKGERWNAEAGRVEAVPGSDIYVQQSAKHGKDYGALNDLNTTTDLTTKTIDKILDPKNKSGFEGNFGGYNAAFATQYAPGQTQDVKADLETLKSQLKTTGLKLIRQGGSIGAMTEKEWPIVQNMIDTITPYMSEDKARETLKEIQARVANIRDTAKDTYDTTWGNSQYHKELKTPKDTTGSDNLHPEDIQSLINKYAK